MAPKRPSRQAGPRSPRARTKPTRRYRPALEPFEPRVLLTVGSYTVDALTDTGTGSGLTGDLRYAITQADANPGSTIIITASGTDTLTGPLPAISANTTIGYSGSSGFTIQGGGSTSDFNALTIDSGVTVSISNVTFTNFHDSADNSSILIDDGSLTLQNCNLTNSDGANGAVFVSFAASLSTNQTVFSGNHNTNGGDGGAIFNEGSLTLDYSTFSDNSTTYAGGAIFNFGTIVGVGLEISGNSANQGGGIFTEQSPGPPSSLTLTNSTIANNTATYNGGGLEIFSPATLTNDTISGNTAPAGTNGAGIFTISGTILNNTIVAQNLAGTSESDVDSYSGSTTISGSDNLIGNTTLSGISNGSNGNLVGTSGTPLQAQLGPLQNNGGFNQTMALMSGSPALNAGSTVDAVAPSDSMALPYDQRGIGFPRVVNGSVDIGAFQTQVAASNLSVSDVSGIYGGTVTLTATLTSSGNPVSGELVDFHLGSVDVGTATTGSNGQATLNSVSLGFVDAATYTGYVTASFAGDSSDAPSNGAANLTVTPAPLVITANNASKVYGQTNPTLTCTLTGILNNDAVSASFTTPAGQYSDVQLGGYPITLVGLTGAKALDYSTTVPGGSFTPGTLTVTPAPLVITANNASKVYGQTNPTLTGTVSGVLNGDDVSAQYATTATQYSDVQAGGYPIILTGLTGAKALDYSTTVPGGSFTPGTLTVTPAPLTVVVNNATKLYGATVPVLSGTVGGVLNGDDVTVRYATTAGASSDVVTGGYPITTTGLSGTKSKDYTIAHSTPGRLTVTPASLTITAANLTRIYGQPNPQFLATYGGFVLGQNPSVLKGTVAFSTSANTRSHVGLDPVTPFGVTSADYAIHFIPGTLAVIPARLTVTPVSVTKAYGLAVPTLSAIYSGFVNGDSPSSLTTPLRLSTTATAESPAGAYPIIGSGASSPDYTISYGVGNVTVAAPTSPGRVAFLNTLYWNILGRAPEPSGMAAWLQSMANGLAPMKVFQQIYFSPEAVALRARRMAPAIGPERIVSLAFHALNQTS
jgi:hypothetical protein